MTRARFRPNPRFESEYLASSEAVDLALAAATEVADLATDDVVKRTESLADSINAVAGVEDGRALGRVNADDFKAHWIEFGAGGQPPRPYLRPAAEAVLGAVTGGDR